MPKKTPEEEALRDQALQEGLKKAVEVPYNLAKEVNCLWPTLVQLATVGNLQTISDLQVSSQHFVMKYVHYDVQFYIRIWYKFSNSINRFSLKFL